MVEDGIGGAETRKSWLREERRRISRRKMEFTAA
jgi:hypothetical protein